MADVDTLASKYETALAAHQDDPKDEKKRAAADKAGKALSDARGAERASQGRPAGMVATVVTTDDEE